MSFNNRWTICSSYDFQAHQQRSQRRCCFSQTALLWFEELPDLAPALRGLSPAHADFSPAHADLSLVHPDLPAAFRRRSQAHRRRSQLLPGASKVLSRAPRYSQTYHNHSHGTPVAVIRDPSYSEGRPECPPRVWYSPEIDTSKFTLRILSDTPGVFQWLKYILLMYCLYREPKIPLWLTTAYRRWDFPGLMTENRWPSVDAHLHDGAGRVLQSVLPWKAAKNSVMTDYSLSEVWFPRMHDQKLSTLHSRSFSHSCIHNMELFNLAHSIIHIGLAAFLEFSFTFFVITTWFFNNTSICIIMISTIPCLSVNTCHQLQDRSIRCSGSQNKC